METGFDNLNWKEICSKDKKLFTLLKGKLENWAKNSRGLKEVPHQAYKKWGADSLGPSHLRELAANCFSNLVKAEIQESRYHIGLVGTHAKAMGRKDKERTRWLAI